MDRYSQIPSLWPVLQGNKTEQEAALCQMSKPNDALGSQKARHGRGAEHHIKEIESFSLPAILQTLHWKKDKARESFAPIFMAARTVNCHSTESEHNVSVQNIALS